MIISAITLIMMLLTTHACTLGSKATDHPRPVCMIDHWGVRRGAPAPHQRPHTTMVRRNHQMTSKCDSELSLPPERVKYAVVNDSKVVVGTSTTSSILCTRCPGESLVCPRGPPEDPLWSQP